MLRVKNVPRAEGKGGRVETTEQAARGQDNSSEVRGIGARRAADALRIALRLAWEGLDVHPADVEQVAADGLLCVVGEFRGRPLYEEAACLEPGAALEAGLRASITRRRAWVAASLTTREAAERCQLKPGEFEAGARDAGLQPGLLGRWEIAAVDAFAADGAAAVRDARTLGWKQAAARLGLREREVEHLVEAGLLSPAAPEGPARFTVAAVDQAASRAGLDWASARAVPRGAPSPWRELAGPLAERDQLVDALVNRLRADGVDAWARYSHAADRWTVDWPAINGGPTRDEVARSLPPRLDRAVTARRLVLLGPVGQTMHWAAAMLRPGAAVVLDCESTGLGRDARVVEVAVVDADTGAERLNTLVHPGVRIPIPAQRVHEITDAMVAGARTWDRVLPDVLAAAGDRATVLAYNEAFDRPLIVAHSRMVGANPGRLGAPGSWGCLMRARSAWLGTTSHRRLGGRHRALGDAQAARRLLPGLARRPEWTISETP